MVVTMTDNSGTRALIAEHWRASPSRAHLAEPIPGG
jgi:hypothetical protein